MKPSLIAFSLPSVSVTPFVGVWIETHSILSTYHLMIVTPFVGVWIETKGLFPVWLVVYVTPFVGVWIETVNC